MQLMRATEVPTTSRDLLFRASRWHAALLVFVCLAACVAMIFYHWPRPRPAYYISAAIILLLLLMRRFITARFHASNWLVRMGDEGLFLHYRSYLNEHLSADDPTVVFLPFHDIRSARLVREKVETPDPSRHNTAETQILHWVEFDLAIDPAPLAAALDTERSRPAAMEKHWHGESSTLYLDYPVLMQPPSILRVKWQVVPRASVFLDALRPRVEIAPMVALTEDFSHLQGLNREEQLKRLRQLDQRGQTIAAVYMARRLYGGDLADATKFVEELREGVHP